MAGIEYRSYSAVLVLSETVLVLVIESRLSWCYVRSTNELRLNETKLVRLSEHEHRARDRLGSLLRRASHAGLPIGGRDFDRLEEIVEMIEAML